MSSQTSQVTTPKVAQVFVPVAQTTQVTMLIESAKLLLAQAQGMQAQQDKDEKKVKADRLSYETAIVKDPHDSAWNADTIWRLVERNGSQCANNGKKIKAVINRLPALIAELQALPLNLDSMSTSQQETFSDLKKEITRLDLGLSQIKPMIERVEKKSK